MPNVEAFFRPDSGMSIFFSSVKLLNTYSVLYWGRFAARLARSMLYVRHENDHFFIYGPPRHIWLRHIAPVLLQAP